MQWPLLHQDKKKLFKHGKQSFNNSAFCLKSWICTNGTLENYTKIWSEYGFTESQGQLLLTPKRLRGPWTTKTDRKCTEHQEGLGVECLLTLSIFMGIQEVSGRCRPALPVSPDLCLCVCTCLADSAHTVDKTKGACTFPTTSWIHNQVYLLLLWICQL